MTERLKDALRQLNEDELEQVTRYVESLVSHPQEQLPKVGEPAKLDWIGGLKDGPWRSGLEAQQAANHYRIFLLERGMSR